MENNYVSAVSEKDLAQSSSSLQQIEADGVGNCPVCENQLHYTKNDKEIECPFCAHTVAVKDIKAACTQEDSCNCDCCDSDGEDEVIEIADPLSALVYLERFFADYDWDAYKSDIYLEIPEIDDMIELTKMRRGAEPSTWILDFESKILPFTKKLEGLLELEKEFLTLYDGKNSVEFRDKYDLYQKITEAINEAATDFFNLLLEDIDYAKRFGAEEETVSAMKVRYNDIASLYNQTVREFNSPDDLPSVQGAKALRKAEVGATLAANGIDAEATYNLAVELSESPERAADALRLFEAIRDYADSAEYIKKLNTFFNFNDKIIKLANKHFLVKRSAAPTINMNELVEDAKANDPKYQKKMAKKGAKKEQPEPIKIPVRDPKPTVSLYEVIDGKAYEPALVSGITSILKFYGNKLYYIKRDRAICCYDAITRIETVLDQSFAGGYPLENVYHDTNETAIYLRKKLVAQTEYKVGCFKAFFSMFKKKKHPFIDTKNNYSVIKIDLINNTASVIIDRLVDVTECFNDRMFYIAYRENVTAARRSIDFAPSFMVCDLKSGKNTEVLGDDCHIHGVFKNSVIYTTWDPNELNRMLFSYDLATDVTTLIEANVFEYFDTVDQRVYYTVGNKKHSLLFSNNFDGTDRIEIMKGVKKIVASRAGNVFLTRGTKRNTTLFKVSPDGEDIELVCSDLSHIVSIDEEFIYYTDGEGALRVVDVDGEVDRKIADDVDASNIIIDKDAIYFLRREQVGRDREAYSLYRTDLNGRNIKKLIFNVTEIKNYDSDTIYVYKCSTTDYIATVYENGVIKDDKKVKFKVSKFFTFDKKTETEIPLLSLGLPDEESKIEKRGCLKKDLKYTVTYDEISSKVSYKKEGLTKVGEVYAEQTTVDLSKM